MELLKNIVTNGLMVFCLSFGLTVSAIASPLSDFEETKAQAEKGSALDQALLGNMYFDGISVRQNYERALYWYQQSAKQGNPAGQFWLGSAYYTGKGINQDYAKALQWFRKSADQNDIASQNMVGLIYEYGNGININKTTAKEWYGKSCDNGDQIGCNHYKRLNEQGY